MLALVCVLESNDCSVDEIAAGLTTLIGLPNFKPEHADAIREALRPHATSVAFADALHSALVADAKKFLTFDKAFARQGDKLKMKPDVVLV
jgi:predicted nucleic-acid-binding protein